MNHTARTYADTTDIPNPIQKQTLNTLQKIHKLQKNNEPFDQYLTRIPLQPTVYQQQKKKKPVTSIETTYTNSTNYRNYHTTKHQT